MAETKASGPRRRRLLRIIARAAAVAAIGGGALLGGASFLVRRSVGPYLHDTLETLAAPVAVVPGASIYRDGTPSPQVEDRLAAALALMRAGRVERILVSGAERGAYDEAGPMRRWLIHQGVARDRLLADHAGFRTLDTMERAARVYGVTKAIVCTQRFHLARAVFLARRAGIDADGLAADGRRGGVSAGDYLREVVATLVAVVDSYVIGRQPRVAGPVAGPTKSGN